MAGDTENTTPGKVNRNQQEVLRKTTLRGTDHNQWVYVLRCQHCQHEYGANGSDIHQRKCPECQGGKEGLSISTQDELASGGGPVRSEKTMNGCPFCKLDTGRVVWESGLAYAIRDMYPVSEGHTLIIPHEHVENYFVASDAIKTALWEAVEIVKNGIDAAYSPDGYNMGFNAGVAAGQTVMHLHIHLIPRYVGDSEEPMGGVRGVIPGKQKY